MQREEILRKINEVIKETINREISDEDLHEDVDIITTIGINSIDAINILVRIEEVFNFEISDDDLSAELLQTTGNLAAYIESRL